MAKAAVRIRLTEEERKTLTQWTRAATTEQRMVERARIVLLASEDRSTQEIALALGTRPARVSKWRQRFAKHRVAGLADAPRPGKPRQYDQTTEQRVLAQLDQRSPEGYAGWSGKLVAQALRDVSAHQVWRVLRKHNIALQRRRSWCISTDPEFAAKAADVVGLYLNPPENALVVSVDEKPSIQALE